MTSFESVVVTYCEIKNHFAMYFNCLLRIRPRNIYWEDWKYTSFVILFCYSQNIRRLRAMGGDKLVADVVENIIEIPVNNLMPNVDALLD